MYRDYKAVIYRVPYIHSKISSHSACRQQAEFSMLLIDKPKCSLFYINRYSPTSDKGIDKNIATQTHINTQKQKQNKNTVHGVYKYVTMCQTFYFQPGKNAFLVQKY